MPYRQFRKNKEKNGKTKTKTKNVFPKNQKADRYGTQCYMSVLT